MNELSGLQVKASVGLINDEGLFIPDISDALSKYESFPSVEAFNLALTNISSLIKVSIFSDVGNIGSDWTANVSYLTGDTVRYNSKAYEASTSISGSPIFQGIGLWTEINQGYEYPIIPSPEIPIGTPMDYFGVKINSSYVTDYSLQMEGLTGNIIFNHPLLISETWDIEVDLYIFAS